MQKFLKRNWKQASEAADQYLNGVDVKGQHVADGLQYLDGLVKQGLDENAIDAAVRSASMDIRKGAAAGLISSKSSGKDVYQVMAEARANSNNMLHVSGIRGVADMRDAMGYSAKSDLQAVGAIAATGVVGFSAVAGAANLIRGED